MPRLNARPDARDGGATSFDVQTHHPALKPRVSRSTSLVRRVTPRGRGTRILLERGVPGTNPSKRQSGSNSSRCVFTAPPAPLRRDDAASTRPSGRARRRRDLGRHPNSPSRARTARLRLGVHYFMRESASEGVGDPKTAKVFSKKNLRPKYWVRISKQKCWQLFCSVRRWACGSHRNPNTAFCTC